MDHFKKWFKLSLTLFFVLVPQTVFGIQHHSEPSEYLQLVEMFQRNWAPPVAGCQIMGSAPDIISPFGVWRPIIIDTDGDNFLIVYSNPNAPTRPGFFKNVVFVWSKQANVEPWVAYVGDEEIKEARVSMFGHVAILRYFPPTLSNPAKDELVVCRFNPSAGTGRFDPYACALNPNQAISIETVLYNSTITPTGFPSPPVNADGAITSFDWGINGGPQLFWGRTKLTNPYAVLDRWDESTSTQSNIESVLPPVDFYTGYWINGTDLHGTVSYQRRTPQWWPVRIQYRGAFPIGTGIYQIDEYYVENIFSATTLNSNAFFAIPNGTLLPDFQGILGPGFSGPQSELWIRTSQSNYNTTYPNGAQPQAPIVAPNTPDRLANPIYGPLSSVGQALVTHTRNRRQIDVFQHTVPSMGTGGLGTYTHYATVLAQSPFVKIELIGISWEGIIGKQFGGTGSVSEEFVLIECN